MEVGIRVCVDVCVYVCEYAYVLSYTLIHVFKWLGNLLGLIKRFAVAEHLVCIFSAPDNFGLSPIGLYLISFLNIL